MPVVASPASLENFSRFNGTMMLRAFAHSEEATDTNNGAINARREIDDAFSCRRDFILLVVIVNANDLRSPPLTFYIPSVRSFLNYWLRAFGCRALGVR